MFHEGDLQSGISLAISQQKTVVCFVRDDSEESTVWEEQWLQDPRVSQSLTAKAVVLRIRAQSQEAGFLAAFCSIDRAPTLILIHSGQLKDNIVAGVGQEDFTKRIRAALGDDSIDATAAADTDPVSSSQAPATGQEATPSRDARGDRIEQRTVPVDGPSSAGTATNSREPRPSTSSADQPPPQSSPDPSQPPSYSTATLQSTFPDRISRLESNHQQQQDAERAKAAAAKARRDAEQAPGKPKTARNDYATQQRQRLAEAKQERERIMAQIEADKVARKQREKDRKEAERATMSQLGEEQPLPADPRRPARRAGAAASANIQVRLFSGRTLRHTFPATATLAKDLRAWVDDAAAEDTQQARPPPYIFKHILNPLPSRTVEVGEENQSLADLGLLPSATLVLVPVQGAAMVDAFGSGAAGGLLGTAFSAASGAVGLVGSTLGWGASTLGSIVGMGGRGGTGTASSSASPPASAASAASGASQPPATDGASDREDGKPKVRVRTLADRRADEAKDKPETWYNGNQTSYQPKDDPGDGPS